MLPISKSCRQLLQNTLQNPTTVATLLRTALSLGRDSGSSLPPDPHASTFLSFRSISRQTPEGLIQTLVQFSSSSARTPLMASLAEQLKHPQGQWAPTPLSHSRPLASLASHRPCSPAVLKHASPSGPLCHCVDRLLQGSCCDFTEVPAPSALITEVFSEHFRHALLRSTWHRGTCVHLTVS